MRRKKKVTHSEPRLARLKKKLVTVGKCLVLFVVPMIIGAIVSSLWYKWMFKHEIHFSEKLEVIATAWIAQFGVLYSLLVAIAVNTVWTEYKSMRAADKRYDFDAFIDLMDEDLSPLVHTMVAFASLAVLAGFLLLKYPTAQSGIVVIFGVSFLLTLMFVVVIEIDDPCAGLWVIKSIPKEWLEVDIKLYREERSRKYREEFRAKNRKGHNKDIAA